MQSHNEVIKMLVSEYDADINCRDYSGKKPRQVAGDGLTIESQALLEYFRSHSDSIDSSGYGSLYGKFGSTSSTPSVMLASQYSNSEKGSKNDASEDKNRSRSSSLGRFLMKKKGKKERGQVPSFPQSHTSAGSQGSMIYRERPSAYSPAFEAIVLRSSFRRILGSSLDSKHGRPLYTFTV
ncbi:ankyrin repeat domain-containing protein SOWAHC-like isoform X2 [Montipora capricornis]|uniref:ankyrin repeat domain-containing protein SOWAHC-like isoform X2 n=1 Tax=Montipora capricornis TaxID=246305 RepID=UPI0035F1A09A